MGVIAFPAALSDHYYKHACAAIFTPSSVWTWNGIIGWATCNWPLGMWLLAMTMRREEAVTETKKKKLGKIEKREWMKWRVKRESENRCKAHRVSAKWLMMIQDGPLCNWNIAQLNVLKEKALEHRRSASIIYLMVFWVVANRIFAHLHNCAVLTTLTLGDQSLSLLCPLTRT